MDTRRVKRTVKFFFSKNSKLVFIISSRKCLTLLKAKKILKLAVNTAVIQLLKNGKNKSYSKKLLPEQTNFFQM